MSHQGHTIPSEVSLYLIIAGYVDPTAGIVVLVLKIICCAARNRNITPLTAGQ
jgi:hypothetical protein